MFFEEDKHEYKLVAPDVDTLIRYVERSLMNPRASTPALFAAMEPLFRVLEPLAPLDRYDEVKTIWLRIPRGTIEDYGDFEEEKEYGSVKTLDEFKNMWLQEYPDEILWYRLVVVRSYNKDGSLRYYGMSLGNENIVSASLDDRSFINEGCYEEGAAIKLCELIIPSVKESISLLENGEYNDLVERELPYRFRKGVIKRSEIWSSDPKLKEYAFDGLSEENVNRFKSLIKSGINNVDKIGRIKDFTANDFFKACKIGYEAIGKDCNGYSLPDLYMRYSDGRDEGLTGQGHGLNEGPGIDFDDPTAWDQWYFDRKRGGGHPWEVVPGGNSTHMSLSVYIDDTESRYDLYSGKITVQEFKESLDGGYYFYIGGPHRQYESVSFYLALHDAGYPVVIGFADELVASFEGSDYIGVVPHHVITRYCEDLFPDEFGDILDFTHVFKDEDPWFDMVKWLPEEPAKLINP